jgi:hypothetical protein
MPDGTGPKPPGIKALPAPPPDQGHNPPSLSLAAAPPNPDATLTSCDIIEINPRQRNFAGCVLDSSLAGYIIELSLPVGPLSINKIEALQ